MRTGTKSLLFGVHCFLLHPWFVAMAWRRLYGFPWDPRLWVAFIVHDWGYWGCRNMDDEEGEKHVELGAAIMGWLFDRHMGWSDLLFQYPSMSNKWHDFCLYHSRFYAKQAGKPFSRLCVADKLSFAMTPRWLYLPMANWSGEIHEYMKLAEQRTAAGEPRYASMALNISTQQRWFEGVKTYMIRWCARHKNGANDTWTPNMKGHSAT